MDKQTEAVTLFDLSDGEQVIIAGQVRTVHHVRPLNHLGEVHMILEDGEEFGGDSKAPIYRIV